MDLKGGSFRQRSVYTLANAASCSQKQTKWEWKVAHVGRDSWPAQVRSDTNFNCFCRHFGIFAV